MDNILGTDLADMQLVSTLIKDLDLCVIDIYSKYTWVIPLKVKKEIAINNAFQKVSNESKQKPNKIWVYKGSEFYDRSMKSFLQNNGKETYSTHKEGKSAIAERLIRTFKNKIYKYIT